jgi:hypothetical protein
MRARPPRQVLPPGLEHSFQSRGHFRTPEEGQSLELPPDVVQAPLELGIEPLADQFANPGKDLLHRIEVEILLEARKRRRDGFNIHHLLREKPVDGGRFQPKSQRDRPEPVEQARGFYAEVRLGIEKRVQETKPVPVDEDLPQISVPAHPLHLFGEGGPAVPVQIGSGPKKGQGALTSKRKRCTFEYFAQLATMSSRAKACHS